VNGLHRRPRVPRQGLSPARPVPTRPLAAVVGLALLVIALALPALAFGHALLQTADPAPGATLGTAPSSVRITFGEPPEPRLSSIKVLDSQGTNHAMGSVALVAGDPASLTIAVAALPDGIYTVSWRTVSAVDGHVAAGSYAFGVGVTPPTGGTSAQTETSVSGTPPAIIARFLLYAGLIGLLGAAYVGFFVARRAAEPAADQAPGPGEAARMDVLVRLATGAWLVAAIGTAFTVAVAWQDAGGEVTSLLGTSTGLAGISRMAVALLGGVPIAFVARGDQSTRRRWLGLAGIGAILGMTVDVATGHAAASSSGTLGLAAQWAHVVAAGLWIGGLGALLLAVRGSPSADKAAAIRRFSTWAAPWIGLVAVTGVVRAVQEVGTIPALLQQPYGQIVLAKTVGLLVLAALGATNRWWSVPAADHTLGRLRRIGTAEIGTAAVIIALAAALVNGVPPVSVGATAAAAAPPIVVTGADRGTSLRVRLAITPGAAGKNTFNAAVTDYDTGNPLAATNLSLKFSLLSRTGVGDSSLDLQTAPSAPAGVFQGSGANLSVDGIWRITATVSQAGTAAEVELVVATNVPAQNVDVLPAAGQPTIYTVHVPDGTTAQIYLDPETAGHDELHCTFFDAAGTERPITQATMSDAANAGELLAPRLLEPGHFVSEIDVQAGNLPVDIVGIDATGVQVHVHATIEVQP